MKHLLFTLLLVAICGAVAHAQAPQFIQYQGVALDVAGQALANRNIGLRITLLDGSLTGTTVYAERHAVTTGAAGVYQLLIGGGSPITAGQTFAGIGWGSGAKYLQLEIDKDGGTNYTVVGTTQLVSVPYALYAERVNPANLPGGQGFNYAIRCGIPDTIRLKRSETTFLPYQTFWLDGAEERLGLQINGLPAGVTVRDSDGSGQPFSNIIVEGANPTIYIDAECAASPGVYPITLNCTSQATGVQRSASVMLKITPNPLSISYLNFNRQNAGGSGCGDSGGQPPINAPTPSAGVVQTEPGKATLSGIVASRTSIPLPPFNLQYGLYFSSQFEIEFQQPDASWCGDPIPVTVPLQTITLSGDFGSVDGTPPAATRTIQGTGVIRPGNSGWSTPEIFLDQIVMVENGVPCTTWQLLLQRQ
jgi:hypothetical protein